jgi:hypothetical protein
MFLIVGLAGYPLAPSLWVLVSSLFRLIPIGNRLLPVFRQNNAPMLSKATDAAE